MRCAARSGSRDHGVAGSNPFSPIIDRPSAQQCSRWRAFPPSCGAFCGAFRGRAAPRPPRPWRSGREGAGRAAPAWSSAPGLCPLQHRSGRRLGLRPPPPARAAGRALSLRLVCATTGTSTKVVASFDRSGILAELLRGGATLDVTSGTVFQGYESAGEQKATPGELEAMPPIITGIGKKCIESTPCPLGLRCSMVAEKDYGFCIGDIPGKKSPTSRRPTSFYRPLPGRRSC